MDEGEGFKTSEIVYGLLVAGIILWTAYYLGSGFLYYQDLMSDPAQMRLALVASLGQAGASSLIGLEDNSAFRANFAVEFWEARLRFWLMPTLGFGVIALLLKPR